MIVHSDPKFRPLFTGCVDWFLAADNVVRRALRALAAKG